MKSLIIYALGGIIEQGLGFVLSPIMTRLLCPAEYGILALVGAIFSVISLFQFAGMDWAFPFYRVRSLDKKERNILLSTCTFVATLSLSLIVVLFYITFACIPLFSNFLKISNQRMLIWISIWLFFSGLLKWYLYILRYENKPYHYVQVSLFNAVIFYIIFISLAYFYPYEKRLELYLICIAFTSFFAWLLGLKQIYSLTGNIVYNKSNFSFPLACQLLAYGAVLVPSGTMYVMVTVSDRYLLGILSSASEIGIYSLATKISSALLMVKGWFSIAWEPYIISYIRNNPRSLYEPLINRVLRYVFFVFYGIALVGSLWIKDLVKVIYPETFLRASLVTPYLLIAGATSAFSVVASISAIITGKKKFHLIVYSGALIVNLIADIILIPKYGSIGAAIGTLLAELYIFLNWIIITNHFTNVLRLKLFFIVCFAFITFLIIFIQFKWGINWHLKCIISFLVIGYITILPETKKIINYLKDFLKKNE